MTATADVGTGSAPVALRISGIRRSGMALAMIIAPWGFVVTNTAYALAIRDGGNEATSLDALALYAAHPDLVRIAVVAGMLGCLLLVPAVLGVFRLAPTSRLVFTGGSLMIAGYLGYFAVLNSSLTTLAMAEHGEPVETFAAVLDASQAEPWGGLLFLTFVVGNLIGTALLAVGLLVSRAVPVWAAAGILAWPPLHVLGLAFFGNEVPQVIGAVLQAIGFAGCAAMLLRLGRRPPSAIAVERSRLVSYSEAHGSRRAPISAAPPSKPQRGPLRAGLLAAAFVRSRPHPNQQPARTHDQH